MQKFSLVIDASTQHCYLHLIQDKKIIIDSVQHINNKDLSYKLITYIEQLLSSSKLSYKSLTSVYLVYGPGKFSATRIASVVAKTLTLLNNIDLYVIDRFDYLATDNCLCVLESDGNKYFICYFRDGRKITEPILVTAETLKIELAKDPKQVIVYDNNNLENVILKLKQFMISDVYYAIDYMRPAC